MSAYLERIDDVAFYAYDHPKRRRRFYLALVFATLLFPLMALALIAGTIFLLVPLIAFLLWISMRIYFARMIGNTVLVSELNYPRIHSLTEEMKMRLGYDKRVFVFVYANGEFNAHLTQLFFRRAIFLNSEILEKGVSDDEVRWLVGRFVGYLRARKQAGTLGLLIRSAQHLLVFNLFLLPYERAMVSTGDRLAVAAMSGNVSSAISALQKLFVGKDLGYALNPEGLIAQHREIKGSFFGFLARIASGFPHMTMRYVDLIAFAKVYFPSHYAKFVAANPAIPDDIVQLASLPEKPPEFGARAQSGMAVGWATCCATLAALAVSALLIAVANKSDSDSYVSQYDPSPVEEAPADEPPALDTFGLDAADTMATLDEDDAQTEDYAEAGGLIDSPATTASDTSAQNVMSRELEALDGGYSVVQEWSELTVPNGYMRYVDVDARVDQSYLVLARSTADCDVDAIVNDQIKDDSPTADASVWFNVSEPGTIRVQLPITTSSESCLVGVGVYGKLTDPVLANY